MKEIIKFKKKEKKEVPEEVKQKRAARKEKLKAGAIKVGKAVAFVAVGGVLVVGSLMALGYADTKSEPIPVPVDIPTNPEEVPAEENSEESVPEEK